MAGACQRLVSCRACKPAMATRGARADGGRWRAVRRAPQALHLSAGHDPQTLCLSVNYRSSARIVATTTCMIQQNRDWQRRQLRPHRGPGPEIHVRACTAGGCSCAGSEAPAAAALRLLRLPLRPAPAGGRTHPLS